MRNHQDVDYIGSAQGCQPLVAINMCLKALANDREHDREDEVCGGMNYTGIFNALLLARDEILEHMEIKKVEWPFDLEGSPHTP
jgi:hypothetical protein